MVEVDSTALHQVARALGVRGLNDNAVFQDEQLQQVVDVGPLIRRGMTLAGSEGIYIGVFQNDHAAAGVLTSTVDPYAVAGTAGWPNPIPDNLEVWVLQCSALLVTAGDAGVFGDGQFDAQWPAARVAWGTPANRAMPLALYDAEVSLGSLGVSLAEIGSGEITKRLGIRIPRGVTLRWTTESTGVGTPEYRLLALVGLFPIGMGQDAMT